MDISMKSLTCPAPDLDWRGDAPASRHFDDIYYATGDGIAESRFVFLDGCGVQEKWQTKPHLVIGETGFGTGLNFLVTATDFLADAPPSHRLTYISAEAYPLRLADIERAHRPYRALRMVSEALCDAYPPPAPGFHSVDLADGRIKLLLLFGDAADQFAALSARIDAWYLDGFSPATNPEMWTAALYGDLVRLSVPGTTLATFSAAGHVRRGLADVGFTVQKARGFGRKRERIVAHFRGLSTPQKQQSTQQSARQWWSPPSTSVPGPVAIIGGGIAGTMLADALSQRGVAAVRYNDPDHTPAGSRVPAAVIAPRFDRDARAPLSSFLTSAFVRAVNMPVYRAARHKPGGLDIWPTGDADSQRLHAIAAACDWGADWIDWRGEYLHLARSGSYDTAQILAGGQALQRRRINSLESCDEGWLLRFADGGHAVYAQVVLCQGTASSLIHSATNPIRTQWGQTAVCTLDDTQQGGDRSISSGSYISAALSNNAHPRDQRIIGSTRCRQRPDDGPGGTDFTDMVARLPEAVRTRLSLITDAPIFTGTRGNTADHFPLAGPVYDPSVLGTAFAPLAKDRHFVPDILPEPQKGLWMLAGLGSKGYQYAPLLADYLASALAGDPLPLPQQSLQYLHPNRFDIRSLIRSFNT